ncbi:hypothetical protein FRC12_004719 [Ceratobasidium sp. 428]|nr:hypothetical protein FRC12_004719 [Ceratobasidium sp. 428]
MSFNSYIAGLNLPFTGAQALNGLACASTFGVFYVALPNAELKERSEREAGKVVDAPPGQQGVLITVAHTIGLLGPAGVFLTSLPWNGFKTPDWLLRFALPPPASPEVYYGLKTAGVIGTLGIAMGIASTVRNLGPHWHYIGVRERAKVVKSGPFRVVRHPMYALGLLINPFSMIMFWSWIPLVGAGLVAAAFAIKIPMEEKLMINNKGLGKAYRGYQKEVPWRVIPYVW